MTTRRTPTPETTLSPAEWEIMNTVWSLEEPTTVREVLERSYPDGEKAYNTVQTLMNILVRKGFLVRRVGHPSFQYRAAGPRERVLDHETRSFVKHAFGGSFGALASFLVSGEALSDDEIRTLRRLVADEPMEPAE